MGRQKSNVQQGDRFGPFQVLEEVAPRKNNRARRFRVLCVQCKTESERCLGQLTHFVSQGYEKCHGCYQSEIDALVGKRFEDLEVLRRLGTGAQLGKPPLGAKKTLDYRDFLEVKCHRCGKIYPALATIVKHLEPGSCKDCRITPRGPRNQYEIDGEWLTVPEIMERFDLPEGQVRWRLNNGVSMELPLRPTKHGVRYKDGLTMAQWADKLGITREGMRLRLLRYAPDDPRLYQPRRPYPS